MTQGLIQKEGHPLDKLGAEAARAYQAVCKFPTSRGLFGDFPFPNFNELFEEFAAIVAEERTKKSKEEIDEAIVDLGTFLFGEVDVEKGFRPEFIGLDKEEVLHRLYVYSQYAFIHEGKLYNLPISEVW